MRRVLRDVLVLYNTGVLAGRSVLRAVRLEFVDSQPPRVVALSVCIEYYLS